MKSSVKFQNKVVLITGASSGLGKKLAISLSKEGASLALFARNQQGLEETGALCASNPLLIQGDVTELSDSKRAIDQTVAQYGKIDYLILNAAVSMWSRFDQIENPSVFRSLMETNYLGSVYFCHHALAELKKVNGMIVSISSIQGKIGVPYHSGYAASKHALQGFIDSLRTEINLDFLIVSPSWIEGTNLKDQALIKTSPRISKGKGLDLQYCTDEILLAMIKRKKELFLPKKYRFIPWLKLISPRFLKNLINRKFSHTEFGLDEFSKKQ